MERGFSKAERWDATSVRVGGGRALCGCPASSAAAGPNGRIAAALRALFVERGFSSARSPCRGVPNCPLYGGPERRTECLSLCGSCPSVAPSSSACRWRHNHRQSALTPGWWAGEGCTVAGSWIKSCALVVAGLGGGLALGAWWWRTPVERANVVPSAPLVSPPGRPGGIAGAVAGAGQSEADGAPARASNDRVDAVVAQLLALKSHVRARPGEPRFLPGGH